MNASTTIWALRNAIAIDKDGIDHVANLLEQLQDENERIREELKLEYLNGANYAMYEICKEADIQNQDIRNSADSIDGKCAKIADRLKAEKLVRCGECVYYECSTLKNVNSHCGLTQGGIYGRDLKSWDYCSSGRRDTK